MWLLLFRIQSQVSEVSWATSLLAVNLWRTSKIPHPPLPGTYSRKKNQFYSDTGVTPFQFFCPTVYMSEVLVGNGQVRAAGSLPQGAWVLLQELDKKQVR